MSAIKYKELLPAIIESTMDGIYVVGSDGDYILTNNRFHELVRIPKSEVCEKKVCDTFELIADQLGNPVQFLFWIHDLLKSPRADIHIMRFIDGRIFECYSVPLMNREDDSGRVWTFGDITQLKRTEETAKLYLDLMSHDIRNRLQGIVMSVEILNLIVEDPASIPTIADIEDNLNRCANLISKVLVADKIDASPLVHRSLNEALSDSIKMIEKRFANIDIARKFEIDSAIVKADNYLETLFINLLENGVQHNPREDRRLWVSLREDAEGYEASISDNGPGIDDERKKDLFNKSRRYGGVGLHVASQIIGKYGGSLKVIDRIAGNCRLGADFRIWIPSPVVRWG